MAGHQLIDAFLADLSARLPADTVDELADGLIETWQHHLAAGLTAEDAARRAVAEFGTAGQIAAEFVAQAPGRRTARLLLVSGPFVGAWWAVSLVAAKAWTWPVPRPATAVFALALAAVVGMLVTAATARYSYRRTGVGTAGAVALVALDAAMLTAVALFAPVLVWPMAAAVTASLARIAVTVRTLHRPQAC